MIRQLNSTWGTLVFKDDRSHVLLLPRTPSSPVYDPHTRQGRIRALSFRMVWEHWLEGTALPVHRHCAQCRKPTEDRGPRRTEARGGQGPAEHRCLHRTGARGGQGRGQCVGRTRTGVSASSPAWAPVGPFVGVLSWQAQCPLFFACFPSRETCWRAVSPLLGTAPVDLQAGCVADVGAAPSAVQTLRSREGFPINCLTASDVSLPWCQQWEFLIFTGLYNIICINRN